MGSSSLWSHTTQTGEEGAEGILVTIMAMAGILDPMEATTLGQMTETEMEVAGILAMEVVITLEPIMAMGMGGIQGLILAMEEAIILDPIMEGAGILDPIQAMVVPGIPTQTMKTEEVTIQDQITAMAMEVAGILVPIMAMEEVGIRDLGPVDQVACCCHVYKCVETSPNLY